MEFEVYKITNVITQKGYVGITSLGYKKRLRQHISLSFDPKNNAYDNYLHRAIRKYGAENFITELIGIVDSKEEAFFAEQFNILKFDTQSTKNGYNMTSGGDGVPDLCEESRKRMSESQRGNKNHMFGKTGMQHHNYGKHHKESTKQKISAKKKGISNKNSGNATGRKQSLETCLKHKLHSKERTIKFLNVLQKTSCVFCKKETTLANLHRWHKRCPMKGAK